MIRALLKTPDTPATPLARYTQACGVFYMGLGLFLYAWPGFFELLRAQPLQGQEPALIRVLGMAVCFVGWFYVFGGRTNQDSFGLCTVVDRVLVPLFVAPLALTGAIDPMLVGPIAVLDPLLGIGAYVIWRRSP